MDLVKLFLIKSRLLTYTIAVAIISIILINAAPNLLADDHFARAQEQRVDKIPTTLSPESMLAPVNVNKESLCNDGIDNDSDGLTDMQDSDCYSLIIGVEISCDDGIDNDSDGLIDMQDVIDCPEPPYFIPMSPSDLPVTNLPETDDSGIVPKPSEDLPVEILPEIKVN